jgi:GNAT superfamily N-acetyltransferase
MEIITAKDEHLPIIKQIAYDTWPATFGEIISPQQIAYMLEWMYDVDALKKQIKESGHVFILAVENGEYFGYASYETNYKNQPKTKIHKIYILPKSQGKGVGRMLMDTVADAARAQNNYTLTLNVNRQNNAVDFYKRIGFEITGHENIDIGEGFLMEDYILDKKL